MDQQLVHFIQSNPKIMMGKFQPQAHCAWPDDNPFQRVFHISLRLKPQAGDAPVFIMEREMVRWRFAVTTLAPQTRST
ncbi:MAG: hypothetical protein WAV70_05190 [Anaerolineae bacterium]|nr:hypothetical protein [Anaerolineae bacterium]